MKKRMTHERSNGIKSGYWSPNKKEELVHRLAAYENTGLEPEEVIEMQKWILVEERLPEEGKTVLVTCQPERGEARVNRAYIVNGNWHGSGAMSRVTAWMPLPAPYRPKVLQH